PMARDMRAAALALHRFGLGPRAGTIEAIASDPQGALIAELDRLGAALVAAAALPSSGAANRAVFEYNAERNAKDKLARRSREAVRPYVLGRFADMLQAAEAHPAMLLYLNNALSVGPNSVAGINRDRGLNENLAREILELHTLGVRTVYSQADVTSFAKILTGWTIRETVSDPDHGGEFVFLRRAHEPGPQSVIGRDYPANGVEQGRA